ncbi:methyl-accepting chemotaxis protein [Nitratidesulfovibrio vulgaris]|uniref:methyl-accepting chemotaxis protein n=1 Tax=Nitratidesulfovibrio vulgaris TaxID=881 RepID=UPI0001ECFD12|nr:methyl-accepting chemotaxis protein [Nitratidesulfovibrio vulgaris]ADP87036.1 methyl-accepting chemotaxis sensory transducer [Nitratidesulfovibrio vulgaris RCH1]
MGATPDEEAVRNIKGMRNVIEKDIDDSMRAYLVSAKLFGEKPELAQAVVAGDHGKVMALAKRYMHDADADFMTVSDASLKVVGRGHSDKAGDDISNQATARKALQGQTSVGVVSGTVVPFSVRASAPVMLDGRVVGSVSLGRSMVTEAFADSIKGYSGVEFTVFKGDTRAMTTIIKADGKRAIGTKMDNPKVLETVLQRGAQFLARNAILGKEYQTAYWPIKDIDGAVVGMWFIGVPLASIQAAIAKVEQSTVGVSLGIMFVMAAAAFFFARSLARPIGITTAFAGKVAAGQMNETLDVHSNDEVGQLADALRTMVSSLKEKIAEAQAQSERAAEETVRAQQATREADEARREAENARREGMLQAADRLSGIVNVVGAASEQLSAQIEQSSRGALLQSQRAGETATAMEEMNATVLEVARSASEAAASSDATRDKAEAGAGIVKSVVDGIAGVQRRSETLQEGMNDLGKRAEEIGRIMNVISDIADQTNLLALNAAIEAARAGDAGRGFAVVADEVRKLAEKTMNATKEVGEAIVGIQKGTHTNVAHVGETVREIETATKHAHEAGNALHEIVRLAEAASDQVRSIATASEEQSAASDEINRAIEEVNRIASETSDAMGQSAQAVGELAEQAQQLQSIITEMQQA